MTQRDRAGDPPGRREAAGPAGHRQGFPTPVGGSPARPETVSQGFRTAHGFWTGRMASDVPHRRAMRSWPKALGNRLYGSLSTLLGISARISGNNGAFEAAVAAANAQRTTGGLTVCPDHAQ